MDRSQTLTQPDPLEVIHAPRILISESERFSPDALAILRTFGEPVCEDLDRPGLLERVASAHVLWVRLRHLIDAEVLAAAPQLKAIVSPTTGLNHIDLEEASRRGIRVLSLRGEVEFLRDVRATAEHTVALMLGLLRKIPQAADHVRQGHWNRDEFLGNELHRRTVGIVGYGRLGRLVARYLQAFDARVLVSDPFIDDRDVAAGIQRLPLDDLLGQADLVSLHVQLDASTQGFFGAAEFRRMKAGAWFINTSRGELVDELSLLEALQSGRLRGAALDVLCNESSQGMATHPLVEYARCHPELLITPHLGGCTAESTIKTEIFMAEKLRGAQADWCSP